jgi:hypothetical protein
MSDQAYIFPADGFEVGFGVREWKYGSVDHYEILRAVAVIRHGS